MEKNRLIAVHTLTGLAAVAWLAYEIIMAVKLWETFTIRDYAALAGKLAYIIGLLAATLRSIRVFGAYAAIVSPTAAASVRACMGWLSYTLFTLITPVVGLLASLFLAKEGWRYARYTLASNLLAALLYGMTLHGTLYQAPEYPRIAEIIPLPAFLALSLTIAWKEKNSIAYPSLILLAIAPLPALILG